MAAAACCLVGVAGGRTARQRRRGDAVAAGTPAGGFAAARSSAAGFAGARSSAGCVFRHHNAATTATAASTCGAGRAGATGGAGRAGAA